MIEILNLKLVTMSEQKNMKNLFQGVTLKIDPKKYTLKELNGKETAETFYKKELQKTNQREFRIKKAIKKNDDEFYLK